MKTISLFACAMVFSGAASAIAAPAPAVVTNNDGTVTLVQHVRGKFTPSLAHKPKIPSIYDNFATLYPDGPYDAVEGASITGPVNIRGQSWFAAAFTPAKSATVQEVDVAAGYVGGTNRVLIHLYADANGIPGKELWAHKAVLPVFGDCCAIVALNDKDSVQLAAGTQYWVAITTLKGAGDTMAAWNLNVKDQVDQGVVAYNPGNGWQAGQVQQQFAFGVYGR